MRLYKRKGSPYWWVDWNDRQGKRRRASTGTEDKSLAQALAAKWAHQDFMEKNFGATPDVDFNDAAIRYAEVRQRENPEGYKTHDRYRLQTLLNWFGGLTLRDIDAKRIADFVNTRRAVIKDASAHREMTVLRAILYKALREGELDRVPVFPRMRKQPGRTRWLTIDEERRLTLNAPPHLRPIIVLAVDTGGRKSELLRLDWRNVDLERGTIRFVETKNGEDRSVRLTDRARSQLERLGSKPSGPALTYKGRAIKDIKSSFDRARDTAGIEDLRFHDLRHTFASRLVQQGVPLYEVMHLTGHKTLEMVQRYAHLAPDYQDRAIAALNTYGTKVAQQGGAAPQERG